MQYCNDDQISPIGNGHVVVDKISAHVYNLGSIGHSTNMFWLSSFGSCVCLSQ